MIAPTLDFEKAAFARGAGAVIGFDEVGRGAIAGPVSVGAAVLLPNCADIPPGLRDSKLMTAKARERIMPAAADWVAAWALGWAAATVVDGDGIIDALQQAAAQAWQGIEHALPAGGVVAVVDGTIDWLTPGLPQEMRELVRVVVRPKADRDIGAVAAASVLAKVHRDSVMCELSEKWPQYEWDRNKGYGTKAHFAAIEKYGTCEQHRLSWLGAHIAVGYQQGRLDDHGRR